MGEQPVTTLPPRRRARRTKSGDAQYIFKKIRVRPRRQGFIIDKLEAAGWEFVGSGKERFRTQLTFRREAEKRRWGWLTPAGWLGLLLTTALVAALAVVVVDNGPSWRTRYEAWAAVRSLNSGDLDAVEKRLADNRGNPEFAYYFTSKATARALGDALATVAGKSGDEPLKTGVDPHEYELTLTDLAGTLSLATQGSGGRTLSASWTKDFITATTKPSDLYKVDGSIWDKNPFVKTDAEKRRDQDTANRSNLMLLLSRGYWSSDFLEAVTSAYYAFDVKEGDDAWPKAHPGDDVGYAPAPTGVYLTDGILALTAALTANPAASEWAFTDFQPETVKIADTDLTVGKFTHYLMFEHKFPESDGESIGMTTTLTALSSAIDSVSWASGSDDATSAAASSESAGPMHDAVVLQALAHQLDEPNQCSWWVLNCIDNAATAVWHWVKHWGHSILDILTVATSFAPPPFGVVAVAPAALNATWYAVDGDYAAAGLSLAAAVPGLAFGKIAKGMEVGIKATKGAKAAAGAQKAAEKSDEVARAASKIRTGADAAAQRVKLKPETLQKIRDAAPKTKDGDFIDPNTGKVIARGQEDIGHKPGYEWRCIQGMARAKGLSREQLIEYANDPAHYQIEDPSSNRSHKYEAATCKV